MIKKTLVTAAGLALLSVLFFGRDAASYVLTSFGWVKDSVKSQVPDRVRDRAGPPDGQEPGARHSQEHARDCPGRS